MLPLALRCVSVIAAIDVGTNSFHLVVASVDADGHFEVLTREREPVRLGSGGEDMKRLTADAMDRGIAALDRMRRIADHAGAATVTAVATSAVREADNRGEFVARARFETAVGSSGTIMALARMCAIRRGDRDSRTGRLSFTAKELRSLTADLANAMTPARRLDIEGLEERRADIIVGGALLLSETFKLLGIKRMEVSDYALREGILFEQMRRAAAPGLDPFHRLEDLRRSGVMYVANSYHEDLGHAEHITDLALELFDGLSAQHGLGEEDRELFEAASLLHNVGIFISHSAHHRHSYYIIRNSEHLTGFTEREIEIIAQVARYHRKSAPKSKHADFASLGSADKNKVRWMAAMLRVAIGLDRSNRQVVTRIRVAHEPGESDRLLSDELRLVARVSPGVDTSVELFTARARSELLESVTGRTVVIESETAETGRATHPTNGMRSSQPTRITSGSVSAPP